MGEYVDNLIAASRVRSYFRRSKSGKKVKVDSYTRDDTGRTQVPRGTYQHLFQAEPVSQPAAAPKAPPVAAVKTPAPVPKAAPTPVQAKSTTGRSELAGGPPSKDELFALHIYTGQGYVEMNDYLRTGAPGDAHTKDDVENLASLLRRSTMKEETTVYRGIYDREDMGHFEVGSVIHDKGFLSFSDNYHVALDFQTRKPSLVEVGRKAPRKPLGGATFELKLPKGTPALDVAPTQKAFNPPQARPQKESEILLQAGQKLRVASIGSKFGVMHVILELVQDLQEKEAA